MDINVRSEIGELEGVIIHTPGREVENMVPEFAERALYSDILNLDIARKEFKQLSSVLNKLTQTFEIRDLLCDILKIHDVKQNLIHSICKKENVSDIQSLLLDLEPTELSRVLIEGYDMVKDNLTKYLDPNRYALNPLHNFFFTRDSSVSILDRVLISKMANPVRERESTIMEAIFKYHPEFNVHTINPVGSKFFHNELSIEGGDVLVARDDVFLIGVGPRTTSQGVDHIIECIKERKVNRNIIVQELPYEPESFIHLDMVFTFLDVDKCMVYDPVILQSNRFLTINISIDNGKVSSIKEEKDIPSALKKLGMDLEPVYCGGKTDSYIQQREQWHSGANFFAIGPGKVIGYGRNVKTIEEMVKHGFDIIPAEDVISGKCDLSERKKYVISIEGSELPRGGGGCRCMTMPVSRKAVQW
jgi:arginine deiminase